MNPKLARAIAETFRIPEAEVRDDASPKTLGAWDSLGHLNLVSELEKAFGISFTMDEILAMESASAIDRLLREKGVG